MFFGKSPSVSSTNYLKTQSYQTSTNNFSSSYIWIDKANFPSGTPLYVILYGGTYYSFPNQDLTTGLLIYPEISATGSDIASIIVP